MAGFVIVAIGSLCIVREREKERERATTSLELINKSYRTCYAVHKFCPQYET